MLNSYNTNVGKFHQIEIFMWCLNLSCTANKCKVYHLFLFCFDLQYFQYCGICLLVLEKQKMGWEKIRIHMYINFNKYSIYSTKITKVIDKRNDKDLHWCKMFWFDMSSLYFFGTLFIFPNCYLQGCRLVSIYLSPPGLLSQKC